jgi:hypothetical protein
MTNHNFLTYPLKIILQIIGEILYFPIWWYSVGFIRAAKRAFRFWQAQEESLGFSIWVKNIFVPMYGQHDAASRIISFFMRLIQIIFRGLILLVWFGLVLLFLLFWLVFPILLFLGLAFQLAG